MGDLKPIGSEKLQGMDKIKRILEITKYNEKKPSSIEESVTTEYNLKLSDGNQYSIVKEKNGYIIKKTLSESINDYLEPLESRKYFKSYSAALRKLNLMAKEFNTLYENESGTSLFSEQKKFFLKTPEKKTVEQPAPEPSPSPEMGGEEMPSPEMGGEEMPSPEMGGEEMPIPEMGGEEMPPSDEEMPSPEMGSEEMPPSDEGDEEVSLKSIQKLVGKLTQKLRTISKNEDEMDSKDLKYVINSVLSAIDVDKLDDEDKDEIISRFDSDEENDNVDIEEPETDLGDEEPDVDSPELPQTGGEIGEEAEMGSLGEKYKDFVEGQFTKGMMKSQFTPNPSQSSVGELSEDELAAIDGVVNKMFKESKVDRVLSKYFILTESEKVEIKKRKKTLYGEINRLAESYEQELVSKRIVNKVPEIKLLGKSNKNNLVFEHNSKIYKVTRRGRVI